MKRVLLALALLGLAVGMASAQHDLTDGVFIAHWNPAIAWSSDAPAEGWCQRYLNTGPITDFDQQNPFISTGNRVVWYLLSAWATGNKTWCGTEFGLGSYNPYLFLFETWGPCTPGENLEIPTAGWPAPLEGTAIVTTDLPWVGNFRPVYYFTGYAYYAAPGLLPFGVDPPTGFGGWGNCLTPPTSYRAACFPAMGVLTPGIGCYPPVPEFPCCIDQTCFILSEEECFDAQGEWHPEWVDCGPPDPCAPIPTAACCVGEECYVVTEAECRDMQGVWIPTMPDCGPPNPCEYPEAVCCVCQDCYIVDEFECADLGGEWHPDWNTCDPNPCPASPTDATSWGSIKAIYR